MRAEIPGMPTGWSGNSRGNYRQQARHQRGTKIVARDYITQRQEPPLRGDLILQLNFYQPDKIHRDLDNLIAKCKPIIDVLVERGWMQDDRQIVEIWARKDLDREFPRTEVILERLTRYPLA